jgi:Arc/MetJ family transcription regulator
MCGGARAAGYSFKLVSVVFKQVGDGRPYPDHARTSREWAEIPPRPVRLDQLITTKKVLDLNSVLATDSTFYGDLFPHVIRWHGDLYLEDGLHRALRAALQQRSVLHVRVLDLDDPPTPAVQPDAGNDSSTDDYSL